VKLCRTDQKYGLQKKGQKNIIWDITSVVPNLATVQQSSLGLDFQASVAQAVCFKTMTL